jgi:uncharacterized membrane protein
MSLCAMIVIGQLASVSKSTPSYISTIEDYVKNGGSCLAIGNACTLFKSEDDNEIKGSLSLISLAITYFKMYFS